MQEIHIGYGDAGGLCTIGIEQARSNVSFVLCECGRHGHSDVEGHPIGSSVFLEKASSLLLLRGQSV